MMVLEAPDSFLFLIWISPDSYTMILAILSRPIGGDVWGLRNTPDSNDALNTGCEEQVLVWSVTSLVNDASWAKKRPCMTTQSQIRLHANVFRSGGFSIFTIHVWQVPKLDHAVFWNGCHCIHSWYELDTTDDVHVRLELILFLQLRSNRGCFTWSFICTIVFIWGILIIVVRAFPMVIKFKVISVDLTYISLFLIASSASSFSSSF